MKIGLIISLLLIGILSNDTKYIILTEEQFKQLTNKSIKEGEIIKKIDQKQSENKLEEFINRLRDGEKKKKKQKEEIEKSNEDKQQEQKKLQMYFKQLSSMKQTLVNPIEQTSQVIKSNPQQVSHSMLQPIQINQTVNTSHISQIFPTPKPKLQPISLTLIPIQTNGDPALEPINVNGQWYFYSKNNINNATQQNIIEISKDNQINKIDGKGNLINGVISYGNGFQNKVQNRIKRNQNQDMFGGLFDSSSFWSDSKMIPSLSLTTQNYYSNLPIHKQTPRLPNLPSLPALPSLPNLPNLPSLPTRPRYPNDIRLTQIQSPVSRYSITDDIKWRI